MRQFIGKVHTINSDFRLLTRRQWRYLSGACSPVPGYRYLQHTREESLKNLHFKIVRETTMRPERKASESVRDYSRLDTFERLWVSHARAGTKNTEEKKKSSRVATFGHMTSRVKSITKTEGEWLELWANASSTVKGNFIIDTIIVEKKKKKFRKKKSYQTHKDKSM